MLMEDIKRIIANNITELRVEAGMKQADLAEKIHYSDKSVSKWERAEAAPDAAVLRNIAEVFGVTVDRLVYSKEEWKEKEDAKKSSIIKLVTSDRYSHKMITSVAIMGIWTLALLLFIIFWLCGIILWQIFPCVVPVSLITQLVLHSVWGKGKYNFFIVSALVLSLIAMVYLLFLSHNWWQIFLLAVPVEILVILGFRIKKKPEKKKEAEPQVTEENK